MSVKVVALTVVVVAFITILKQKVSGELMGIA
jgi:hypothetical protein